MELVTAELSQTRLLEEAGWIRDVFSARGSVEVLIQYGWGTALPPGELWTPARIDLSDLLSYVQKSVDTGLFVPGGSDLLIEDSEQTAVFRLCHESDIHLITKDAGLIEKAFRHWTHDGIRVFQRENGGWVALP